MQNSMRALVVLVAAVAGAGIVGCDDRTMTAPGAAHPPSAPAVAAPASPTSGLIGPRFTGARSDSVLEAVAARWAAAGRPAYAEQLRSIRARRDAAVSRVLATSGETIDGGTTSATTDPALDEVRLAKILTTSTYVFYGGQLGSGLYANSYGAGEMTFIGDVGMINTSFSLIGNASIYGPVTAEIANGGGELLNCYDVMFSTCTTHRLSGSITLNSAPNCGVYAHGNTTFQAWYAPTAISISGGGISVGPGSIQEGIASTAEPVSTVAPTCPGPVTSPPGTTDGTTTGDAGAAAGGGDGGGAIDGITDPFATNGYTPGGGGFTSVQTYSCWENFQLIRLQYGPLEYYYWQDNGAECGWTTTWIATDAAPSSGAMLALSRAARDTQAGSPPGGTPHGQANGRRAVLAASSRIPNNGRVAFVERAPGAHADVILVDPSRVTVQEVAMALSFAGAHQGAPRTRDRGYVLTDGRVPRYTPHEAAVIEGALASLRAASASDVPGFGALPNVEIVLPAGRTGP